MTHSEAEGRRQYPAPNTQHPTPNTYIVFVHGAGSNADFWHEQRTAFPDAHYVDLPSHVSGVRSQRLGVGEGHNTRYSVLGTQSSVEGYADWLAAQIEEADWESVVLNGHSMGGAIALTLALRRPIWLKGIVLTGTGARLRVLSRLLDLLRTDYPAAVDLIVEESFAPPSESLSYKQKALRNGTRRQTLRTLQAVTLADYEACDHFDVMSSVAEISIPTLCIVGDQDCMTPPRYSEYLHEKIKGSRLEVIEGAGHMLPMERAEEYNRKVRRFLQDSNLL